jgi:chromosome segregation ATPase
LQHLEQRLAKMERDMKRVENASGGSREELQEQLDAVKAEVERKGRVLADMEYLLTSLKQRLDKRKAGYQKLFATVSDTVNNHFAKYMARRVSAAPLHVPGVVEGAVGMRCGRSRDL